MQVTETPHGTTVSYGRATYIHAGIRADGTHRIVDTSGVEFLQRAVDEELGADATATIARRMRNHL